MHEYILAPGKVRNTPDLFQGMGGEGHSHKLVDEVTQALTDDSIRNLLALPPGALLHSGGGQLVEVDDVAEHPDRLVERAELVVPAAAATSGASRKGMCWENNQLWATSARKHDTLCDRGEAAD